MSDALTDIARDSENYRWLCENADPILVKWLKEEKTDKQTLAALKKLRKRADIPTTRGYFSAPASHQLDSVIAAFSDAVAGKNKTECKKYLSDLKKQIKERNDL